MMESIRQTIYQLHMLLLLLILQACSASNPIAQAETTEQRAYATYGTFVIFEENAADLVGSGSLPDSVALRLIRADEIAKPVADSLLDALLEFQSIRAEFESGMTSEEKFILATKNLNDWIERMLPLLQTFGETVKGAES